MRDSGLYLSLLAIAAVVGIVVVCADRSEPKAKASPVHKPRAVDSNTDDGTARIHVYTDRSWCAPCAALHPRINQTRTITEAAGWKWGTADSPDKCHVRVFDRIDPEHLPRDLVAAFPDGRIPSAVALDAHGNVLRRWSNDDGTAWSVRLLNWLYVGPKHGPWTVQSLRDEIARHASIRDPSARARTEGVSVREHLVGSPSAGNHGWPDSLVDHLTVDQQHWLHDADHCGFLKP